MKKVVFFIFLFLCSSLYAESYEQKKERILKFLLGYENYPLKSYWEKLDKDTYKILIDIIKDETIPKGYKLRAILSLSYFPTKETKRFLLEFIENKKNDLLLRRRAITSLAEGFGKDVVNILKRYLEDENIYIREITVYALDLIGDKHSIMRRGIIK